MLGVLLPPCPATCWPRGNVIKRRAGKKEVWTKAEEATRVHRHPRLVAKVHGAVEEVAEPPETRKCFPGPPEAEKLRLWHQKWKERMCLSKKKQSRSCLLPSGLELPPILDSAC